MNAHTPTPAPHIKTVLAAKCERALTDIETIMGGKNGPSIQLRGWIRELSTVDGGPPTPLHNVHDELVAALRAICAEWDFSELHNGGDAKVMATLARAALAAAGAA